MFLLKNPFFMFFADFIFVLSYLKIHPAGHLETSKVESRRHCSSSFRYSYVITGFKKIKW